jgi:hypothetical protein
MRLERVTALALAQLDEWVRAVEAPNGALFTRHGWRKAACVRGAPAAGASGGGGGRGGSA